MNQSFNKQQLLRLCKQAEYIDYGMTIKELSDALDLAYDEIANGNFNFKINKVREYFLTHDLPNKLIVRKLNDNVKRIYKDEQANRRIIIAQVKILLSETCPFWVIKTDIKSFYESIDRDKIISKFHDDSLLSYQSMYLIKKLFNNPILADLSGVPRGMNISATLSEIHMRKFDKWIRRFDGIYYYARFVDDIIIFSNSLSCSTNLISSLNLKLSLLAEGLEINTSKTELYDGRTLNSLEIKTGKPIKKSKPLEYLGYLFKKESEHNRNQISKRFKNLEKLKYTVNNKISTFVVESISYLEFESYQNSNDNTLRVTIAQKKVNKIKTRLVMSLLDFAKNKNFGLLEKRVKFLTGNYSIRKNDEGNDLRAGIFYNYLQVNEMKVFYELNLFFKKLVFCSNASFGSKISLTPSQKESLRKYCFVAGFEMKVYNKFTYKEIREIINCW